MTLFLLFFMGATIGSFLGLVADRFPQESIITPSSHCSYCQHQLAPRDLIPVVSAMVNGFHCRYCGQAIPRLYSLLETACGLILVWGWLGWLNWDQIWLLGIGILLSLYDIRDHQYPVVLVVILGGGLACFHPLSVLCLGFVLLGLGCERFSIGFGAGDAYYLAVLSLLTSGYQLIWLVQIASLLGIVYLFSTHKKRPLAFIPFLTLAYLVTLVLRLG